MTGDFLLTFDVELLWGVFFHDGWRKKLESRRDTRAAFDRILEILEEHRIRATFAFVGHLFLASCTAEDGRTHPEMLRPRARPGGRDWYDLDPGSDLERAPLWYGRDLVEQVRRSPLGHEIGAHGFSHAFLDESVELARAEMRAGRRAAAAAGVDARSFVFPKNRVAFAEELVPAGYTHTREAPPAASRTVSFLRRVAGVAPPVGKAHRNGDLVVLPAGLPILPGAGIRRFVPMGSRLREVRKGIELARRTDACFHLWSHPHNFLFGSSRMFEFLDRAMAIVAEARDRGEIAVKTMGEIAA